MSISQIDELTIYELKMVIEVKNKISVQLSEDNTNQEIIGAYYTEVFRRQDEKKKLPPIANFLINHKAQKPDTSEKNSLDMLEKAKMLNTMFGGNLIIN